MYSLIKKSIPFHLILPLMMVWSFVSTAHGADGRSEDRSTFSTPTGGIISNDPDHKVCEQQAVTFLASGGSFYEFYLNGEVAQAQSQSNRFLASSLEDGDSVSVVVTNEFNESDTVNGIVMSVIAPPTGSVTASSLSICEGEEVVVEVEGGVLYEYFVNERAIGLITSDDVYITDSLSYNDKLSVVAYNEEGCSDTIGEVIFDVHDLPSSILTNDDEDNVICEGDEIIFTATGEGSYEFFLNDISIGPSSTNNEYRSDLFQDGDAISLVVLDEFGCSDTSTNITISVVDTPPGISNSNAINNKICEDDELAFSVGGGSSFEFFINGTSLGINEESDLSEDAWLSGDSISAVVHTDVSTCKDTIDGFVVEVVAFPTGTIFSEDFGPKCEGEEVVFMAEGGNQYEFFVNDQLVASFEEEVGVFSSDSLNDGDTVHATVTVDNVCTVETERLFMSVTPIPEAELSISDSNATICAGELVSFSMAGGHTLALYSNENLLTTDSVYETSEIEEGDIISLIVSNNDICHDTVVSVPFTVHALPNVLVSSDDDDNSICLHEEVTFTADGGDNYEFFINGAEVQSGMGNVFVTDSLENMDSLYVAAASAEGCIDTSAAVVMTVLSGVRSENDISTICEGEELALSATGADNYDFYLNGILLESNATGELSSRTFEDGDSITVIADNHLVCEDTSGITIRVNPLPTGALSADLPATPICLGDELVFTGAGGIQYDFQVNGILASASSDTLFSTTELQHQDSVSLTVIDENGCTDDVDGVVIQANPAIDGVLVSNEDNNPFTCEQDEITFTASGGEAYTFFRNGIQIDSSLVGVNTLVVSGLGSTDTIGVLIEDIFGCTASYNASPLNIINCDTLWAFDDTYSLPEDGSLVENVLSNDFLESGVSYDIQILSRSTINFDPFGPTFDLDTDGNFLFSPKENFDGEVNFEYSVCETFQPFNCDTATVSFSVLPVNDRPISTADMATVGALESVTIAVLDNDFDIDDDELTVANILAAPNFGSATIENSTSIRYTHDSREISTSDSLKYVTCDADACDTSVVLITISFDEIDSDNDGISDQEEIGDDPENPRDSDNDNIPDYIDLDDDNDGVLTLDEDIDNDGNVENDDSDNDGIPNYLDNDDDNDGLLSSHEDLNGDGILSNDDCNGNGVPDYLDDQVCVEASIAFSPNNDGVNDTWEIKNINLTAKNKVAVFNRWGNLVIELDNYNNEDHYWSGENLEKKSAIVPDGTYFYTIDLNEGMSTISGFVVVKR